MAYKCCRSILTTPYLWNSAWSPPAYAHKIIHGNGRIRLNWNKLENARWNLYTLHFRNKINNYFISDGKDQAKTVLDGLAGMCITSQGGGSRPWRKSVCVIWYRWREEDVEIIIHSFLILLLIDVLYTYFYVFQYVYITGIFMEAFSIYF